MSEPTGDKAGTAERRGEPFPTVGATVWADTEIDEEVSVRVASYVLRRQIGQGGMGVVFEAVQDEPHRIVAVKLLRTSSISPEALRRFKNESQTAGTLRHAGIAQVFQAGTYRFGKLEIPFYAMEYVSGARNIAEFATKLDTRQILVLFAQVCDAVQHAHERGVIHRDLKPGNILIDADGHVKVIDFGIAYALDSDQTPLTLATSASQLVGTLQYMSPEQCTGERPEHPARSDIYSLGVMLFELLCKRLPYDVSSTNVPGAIHVICEQAPQRPRLLNPSLDRDIETILLAALAKDPKERYESAAALAKDVRSVLAGDPIPRRMSTTYFLGKSARKLTSRHVIITTLVAAAVGVIIAGQIGEWVKQTGLDERYAARLTAWSGASMTGPLRSVTMVLLTPQTDVVELAQRLGVAGVRAGDILTTRALHTALLQKLASAGPRVVAFDIRFRRETPFDQEFAQAARALKESGADVIAVLPAWDTQTDSAPPISPLLAEVFKAGPATFAFEPSLVMYLAVRRLGAESMMSMALLAVSAYWEPGAVPSAEIFSSGLGSGASQVIVRFTREKGGVQTAPAHRIVPISCGIEWHEAPSPNGLKPGDFVGCYYIQIPPDSRLSASQVEYSKVFSASADELRQWFGGKVVLIGDLRPEAGDVVFTLPDGRKLYGVSANALAIDALLDGTAIVTDSTVSIGGWGIGTRVLFATVAGLAGALVGAAFWTSAIRRLSVVALLIMLVIVASLLMYRAAQMLIPPTWSVLSVIATSELSAALARVRRPNV